MSVRNSILKSVLGLLTLSSLILLSACGASSGGGGSEKASTDPIPASTVPTPGGTAPTDNPMPDKIDPDVPGQSFNYIAVIKENQAVTAPLSALGTDLEDAAFIIQLQSNGFPNRIDSMTTNEGITVTDKIEVEKYFVLFINPETGEVEIRVNKNFDFETDATSYQLAITLGTESINVLVNVYDIQKGSEEEALKISSYNELKSFFNGQFVSENIGNDVLDLSSPESDSHNVDELFIQLDRDIDASASAESPWTNYEFDGQLDGDSFVINNLVMAQGNSFIRNPTRFKAAKVKNIGFVDAQLSSTLISSSGLSSVLNTVFVSGVVSVSGNSRVNFSPFSVAGEFEKVYTNLRYDFFNIVSTTQNRSRVSALMGVAGAPIRFRSGYSNGSVHMNKDVKVSMRVAGFSESRPDLTNYGNTLLSDSLFYSAIDFEVSENQELNFGSPYMQVGAIGSSSMDYPDATADDSAYNWRFITNRNMTGRIQHVGNSHRDINNDGQGDANGSGTDLSFAGMTQVEAKVAATFSGRWTEANSHFDITEGQYPVLKGMPYPRTDDAVWMRDEYKADPGIAYQRATFDDYVNVP